MATTLRRQQLTVQDKTLVSLVNPEIELHKVEAVIPPEAGVHRMYQVVMEDAREAATTAMEGEALLMYQAVVAGGPMVAAGAHRMYPAAVVVALVEATSAAVEADAVGQRTTTVLHLEAVEVEAAAVVGVV